ncbi:MAG: 2-oxoacid:acceptor oxidoreductase family protein [Peptococcaceae bacterium]|nr:2-oxoacid:acceptor oxidoreductase family protein [Peptococcaceae bacterium]MDH7525944.1 2-oxoacid:acceptor oxidoreductase family protein [Peptococcaceae bacterium]
MSDRKEVRLSGTGGQGIILGGILLAEAAVLDGKEVVQTQSYGPEARGGASKAEVVISSGPILYPKVILPDFLLVMSEEAARFYAGKVASNGLVMMDEAVAGFGAPAERARVVKIPFARLAREEIGNFLTTNIIAVGALAAAGGIVSLEALEEAVRLRLVKVAALNIKALHLGWERGSKEAG